MHGSVRGAGVSFEWHDFKTREAFDWGRSFHPGSIEVCLNLEGEGRGSSNKQEVVFVPLSGGFYRQGEQPLHPLIRNSIEGQNEKTAVMPPIRLTSRQQLLLASLRDAPVLALAQPVWYQAKALEVAAEFFFMVPGEPELFCQ